ncbi:MAG: pitrilysin family protein [Candidatus Hydrothermales bacterium]
MKLKFKVKKFTLDNGLKVILVPFDREITSFYLIYKVGSKYEYEGKRGISHFLEHMMFKGTKRLKPEEFSRIIQRMGGVDNAFTTEDFTFYHSTVPKDEIYKVIKLEADRMEYVTFKEFESEKKVIIEERRESVENSPYGKFWENFLLLSYVVHPYRYPIIGFEPDILSITKNDLRNWYNKFYTPSNAFIVISGGIDEKKIIRSIERNFSKIDKKDRVERREFYEPEQNFERKMVLKLFGSIKILGMSFHSVPFSHPDFIKLNLFSALLGGIESSRLYKTLVLERNLCNEVSTFCEEKVDKGLFIFYCVLNKDAEFDEVIDIFWKEVEKIFQNSIEESELIKVKNIISAEFLYKMQSTAGRGRIVSVFELNGIFDKIFSYLDELESLKAEEIIETAKKYIKKERCNYLMLC